VGVQLDPSTVAAAGARTAAAGAAYALERRATVGAVDLEVGVLRGTCAGAGNAVYSTTTWIERDRRGTVQYGGGQCSCPVGGDCKHSVALYLTAFGTVQPTPPEPAAPDWEQVLGRIFSAPPKGGTSPLALAFELQLPTAGRWSSMAPPTGASLTIRPLQRGKRENWIQSGAEWHVFSGFGLRGFPPAQARALEAIARATGGATAYFATRGGWIALDRLGSTPPWDLLRDARDAGVALLEPKAGGRSVHLLDEPGEAVIDVVERGGDVELSARLLLPEGVLLDEVVPVGSPPVAAAGRAPDGALTIAAFRRTASPEWRAVREAGPVRVPAADRERFERTALPRITGVGWRSTDGSFAERPPTPPVLEVRVDVAADLTSPTAEVTTGWRYGSSATGFRLPLRQGPYETAIRNGAAEAATLAAVGTVLGVLPGLVDDGAPRSSSTVVGLDVATLVQEVLPRLELLPDVELRIRGELPDLRDLGEPEVRLDVDAGTDWFDLAVTLVVDGAEVPIAPVIAALTAGLDTLFLPDGGYVRLDRPELQRLRELLDEARALSDLRSDGLRVSRLQVSWWEELLALGIVETQERAWIDALRVAVGSPDSAPPLPEGLHAELRPYQREGYEWLARLRRAGLGGVLADDMGLGKTVQSLAMILDARSQDPDAGPFVVVAPTSVVPNWAAEAARFAPSLRVAQIASTQARRGVPLAEAVAGADVVVTSYALFRLEYDDYAELAPSGLLLDEAQNVKNHQSKAFACAKQLPAPVKFAVTGTPMENNLGELWALLSIVAPGLLGSPKQFTAHYRTPIEAGGNGELLGRLRRRTAPFLLRRTKEEVAPDLPSKQEQRIDVELAPAHRRLYSRQLQHERQRVLGLVDDLDRNRIEVLSALTRLRQLAIDPSLVATGDDAAASSKLEVLLGLLEEAAAEGHRTLVFSQFTRFLDRIETRLRASGLDFVRLDGGTRKRAEVVRSFAEGTQPVFLISLKAGGTGLNLTMADYCVLTDPWWNPATEAQAVDRAHRIGQTRSVMVYRLIAKDTIEEKVMALQDRKRALVSDILGGEGGGAISAADIRELLT
jgi:superfamily II DNA or RNA helicase